MARPRENRLAASTSPYLLQHSRNPVDWYPWGAEALERAREEDRPIFLSVGYSACHWCHVMEKDAFSVDEIAETLNRHFVSIKVDREERPDIDALYQGVVQLMGKSGGWPLSVFLTPDGRPFFGGTYFPPRDAYGLPSFRRVLDAIVDAWTHRREAIEESADSFAKGLSEYLRLGLGEGGEAPDAERLFEAAEHILEAVDEVNGGFFGAPKFPHPMELAFLLRIASLPLGADEALRARAREAVETSLDAMMRGGIHDQLGGGFHRYAVDERWAVPHFEKMLYDNALLLRLYAESARAWGRDDHREVALGIVAWLDEMRDPSGAFHSAQDADSEGVEGKYFVWTPEEFEEVLGRPSAAIAMERYGVRVGGNFEGGATVLSRAATVEDLARRFGRTEDEIRTSLEEARQKLLERRRRRVPPATDDKVLAGWNGLAIGALAAAGRLLEEGELVQRARRAADAVLSRLWDGKRLLRTFRGDRARQDAFLEDYAFLCEGLVELFESTGEARWLDDALALARSIAERFWEEETRTFYLGPADGERLLHRVISAHDQAIPSGASSATTAFLRLFALTGEEELGRIAEAHLARQGRALAENPFAFGHLLSAGVLRALGITEVAVLGPEGRKRDALLAASREGFRPDILAYASERGAGPALEGRAGIDGEPAAWICRHFACERPRTEPEDVRAALHA
jgi:uncharacterized protein YyaL (SSP411 family)